LCSSFILTEISVSATKPTTTTPSTFPGVSTATIITTAAASSTIPVTTIPTTAAPSTTPGASTATIIPTTAATSTIPATIMTTTAATSTTQATTITATAAPSTIPGVSTPVTTTLLPTTSDMSTTTTITFPAWIRGVYTEGVYGEIYKPYWIGVRKIGYKWERLTEDRPFPYTPVTFTNWGPSQPDGCCSVDVTCVVVNHWNNLGEWDDQGCDSYVGYAGAVCQRKPM
uniref:C-type lectin domain-containing protein n=1 Tax=Gongylonema pulchrum TaxID=637853 RepID=A0A183CYE2_9BILA